MEFAASLVKLNLDERLLELRKNAVRKGIPVTDNETVNYLLWTLSVLRPKHILEIGTAVGFSAAVMATTLKDAYITTLEIEEERYQEAKENFSALGISDRVKIHLGDAGEILPMMDGLYDFVYLDGAKAQYEKYLPELKRLLKRGGVLFADDVLLYGWVSGELPTPPKRKSIVEKLRGYLNAVTSDPEFLTSVLDVGDGVAVSYYKPMEKEKSTRI